MTKKKVKDKMVSFRIDSTSYKELNNMAKKLGAGTAHNFVRELAERVVNTAGAVDARSAKNEET